MLVYTSSHQVFLPHGNTDNWTSLLLFVFVPHGHASLVSITNNTRLAVWVLAWLSKFMTRIKLCKNFLSYNHWRSVSFPYDSQVRGGLPMVLQCSQNFHVNSQGIIERRKRHFFWSLWHSCNLLLYKMKTDRKQLIKAGKFCLILQSVWNVRWKN